MTRMMKQAKPRRSGDAQVEVGDSSYEARCRGCYEFYKAEMQSEEERAVQLTMPQAQPAV